MSEEQKKDMPAIKAYGFAEKGNKESRFEMALWPVEGKGNMYTGTYKGERVAAFFNPAEVNDSGDHGANLNITRRVGEGESAKNESVVVLYVNKGKDGRDDFLGNAKAGVAMNVDKGFEILGMAAPAPRADRSAEGPAR